MSITFLIGVLPKREETRHRLNVEGTVSLLAKGLTPLAFQSRHLGAVERVRKQCADEMTGLVATITEAIATVEHSHVRNKVKISLPRRVSICGGMKGRLPAR